MALWGARAARACSRGSACGRWGNPAAAPHGASPLAPLTAQGGRPASLRLDHPEPRAACVTSYKIAVLSAGGKPVSEPLVLYPPNPTAASAALDLDPSSAAARELERTGGSMALVTALNGDRAGPMAQVVVAGPQTGGGPRLPAPPSYGFGGGRANGPYTSVGHLYNSGPLTVAAAEGVSATCKGGGAASLC
jgi:hypothetical protein